MALQIPLNEGSSYKHESYNNKTLICQQRLKFHVPWDWDICNFLEWLNMVNQVSNQQINKKKQKKKMEMCILCRATWNCGRHATWGNIGKVEPLCLLAKALEKQQGLVKWRKLGEWWWISLCPLAIHQVLATLPHVCPYRRLFEVPCANDLVQWSEWRLFNNAHGFWTCAKLLGLNLRIRPQRPSQT